MTAWRKASGIITIIVSALLLVESCSFATLTGNELSEIIEPVSNAELALGRLELLYFLACGCFCLSMLKYKIAGNIVSIVCYSMGLISAAISGVLFSADMMLGIAIMECFWSIINVVLAMGVLIHEYVKYRNGIKKQESVCDIAVRFTTRSTLDDGNV